MMTNREEYVKFCKNEALEALEKTNDTDKAWLTMMANMKKHPQTENHPAINLGTLLSMSGELEAKENMKEFLNGFN